MGKLRVPKYPLRIGIPKPLEALYGKEFSDFVRTRKIPSIPLDDWGHGGPRDPHIHVGNEIYLLSKAQWTELSKTIVAKNAAIFGKARSISFEKMGEILSDPENVKLLK
jgi:hypothetical protein